MNPKEKAKNTARAASDEIQETSPFDIPGTKETRRSPPIRPASTQFVRDLPSIARNPFRTRRSLVDQSNSALIQNDTSFLIECAQSSFEHLFADTKSFAN
jgi:hypothetical protein